MESTLEVVTPPYDPPLVRLLQVVPSVDDCHWIFPLAFVAEKVTPWPVVTVSLTKRLASTPSVTELLVAEPAEFVAVTE